MHCISDIMNAIMKKITSVLARFFTKPEYVFVVPALLFGTVSAVLMPQLISNDENMHFIRSYELTELEVKHKCTLPADIKERAFYAIYSRSTPDYRFENKSINESNQLNTDCGTATSYNPLLHIPQAIGVIVAKIAWPTTGGMILLGRLMNVLVYGLLLFFIIRKAKVGKWVLVVIGLTPMMIHMAGSLSGDVMNNIIVLGFITFVFNLFVQKTVMTRRQLSVLFILSALLAVTKLPNLILLLPLLFLPKSILPPLKFKKYTASPLLTRIGIGLICGIVALVVVFVWMKLYDAPVVGKVNAVNPVAEHPYLFLDILFNTYVNPFTAYAGVSYSDWLMQSAFGSFASFRYALPYSVVVVLIGLLVMMALKKDEKEEIGLSRALTPLTISTLIAFVLTVMVITYGLYTAWAITSVGLGKTAKFALGLQGRYFTPLFLLLLPLFISLRKYVSVTINGKLTTGILVFCIMSGSLIYYIVQTVRYLMAAGLPVL